MMRLMSVLLIAIAVALSGPVAGQAQTSGKKATATTQQKKAKKPAPRRAPPKKKNNFTGAVLNCKPPMTYEDWSRCGYGL